jgi:hypothetical protein
VGWLHDRRNQGGVGAYRTEGPHVLAPLKKGPQEALEGEH